MSGWLQGIRLVPTLVLILDFPFFRAIRPRKKSSPAKKSWKIASAYLDVTEPEPLPPEHELWTTPNCYITPHTAGGRHDQDETIVRHFLANLAAFENGGTMTDRVV